MSPVDPRQLFALLAIARHGSFNRAASAEGISQPALSKSIALLERDLGVRVMERGPQGTSLTEAGQILLRRARGLEALLSDARAEIELKTLGVEGPLAIGATPSTMQQLVPEAVSRLTEEAKTVSISIFEGLDDALNPMLSTGALDVVVAPIGGLYPTDPDIAEDVLFTDPFSIGVGPHHPLAGSGPMTLASLSDAQWIVPLPGSAYHRHIQAVFRTAGMAWPTDRVECNSLSIIEKILMRTNRLAIVTRLQTIRNGVQGLVEIPLIGAGQRTIGLRHRRHAELSPLGLRFLEILRELGRANAS